MFVSEADLLCGMKRPASPVKLHRVGASAWCLIQTRFTFQAEEAEAAMENRVTQISREDLEDLREAFSKIGEFHSEAVSSCRF